VGLHIRLPREGHTVLTAYADRKGLSLNSALWLLLQRGLEAEGVELPPTAPADDRRRRS
jgi:hypothetical protein